MAIFTSEDHDKFRTLRITRVAEALELLLAEDANEQVPPERLFRQSVDDALEQRRSNKIERLIEYLKLWRPPNIAVRGQRYCR